MKITMDTDEVQRLKDELGHLRQMNIQIRTDNKRLRDALEKLRNEAASFLAIATPEVHGHTNMAVLRERINAATEALSGEQS